MPISLIIRICLPALIFCACDLFMEPPDPSPPGPPPEKAYHAEILWAREVNRHVASGNPLIEGQYCYLPAYENYYGGLPNIVKINMETGRVEWESKGIRGWSTEKPQKIGAYIYLPAQSGFIYVYNDSDGKLAATVMLGEDETEAKNNAMESFTPAAVSGPYLFWGSSDARYSSRNGLTRFDSRLIDFSKAPDAIQNIAPEQIWSNSWQARIYVNLISENEILYFITISYMPENPCVLVALDAETGDVIWEREAPHCKGREDFSLVLNGERLLVVEETFSSYDKSTGVPVLENIPLGYGTRSFRCGRITLYNNRLFYIGNGDLVSVNADTGALIWSVSPDHIETTGNTSFSTSPRVNNGQVFILHETGLRVYNADTGKFIGVDGSFRGKYGLQFSHEIAIYKDAYIFFNDRLGYVTAIRCIEEEP